MFSPALSRKSQHYFIMIPEDYKDIAPYADEEFAERMELLLQAPGFANAIKYVLPEAEFNQLADSLRQIRDKDTFQSKVMVPILMRLEATTTDGVSDSGIKDVDMSRPRLFISNHRDIVLDASFLGLVMIRNGYPAQEVALGDNLLIYDWIEHLVRLNKGVIVKRNLRLTKALEAAKQLSGYIHYCINQKRESVWIAQREGRAKDSTAHRRLQLRPPAAPPRGTGVLAHSACRHNNHHNRICFRSHLSRNHLARLRLRHSYNRSQRPRTPHGDAILLDGGIPDCGHHLFPVNRQNRHIHLPQPCSSSALPASPADNIIPHLRP